VAVCFSLYACSIHQKPSPTPSALQAITLKSEKPRKICAPLNDNFFPLVRGTPSFAFMFTPAALTANSQSVTVGW